MMNQAAQLTSSLTGIARHSRAAALPCRLLAALLFACGMLPAQAPDQGANRTIQGRVLNGTTGKPVAKAQVNYVLMQRGTTPVASVMTEADGRFRFASVPAPVGGAPALLRADYQGATYSKPLLPGQPVSGEMEIQVFDAGGKPGMVAVKEHAIFFHPSGNTLLVLEQVLLGNDSKPPETYVNPKGTYPFTLPASTREGLQVTVEGPGGMPISQIPAPREAKNSFAINYPIRPGETQVRIQYALDYKSPFKFSKSLDLLPEKLHVVTPGKDVQIGGEEMTALGADPSSGFIGYQVMPKGKVITLDISGDVPESKSGASEESEEDSAALVPIKDPVSSRRWMILSAAGLVMLLGFIYHYRRS